MEIRHLTFEQLEEHLANTEVLVRAKFVKLCEPLAYGRGFERDLGDAHPDEFVVQIQTEHPSVGWDSTIEETILANLLPGDIPELFKAKAEQIETDLREMDPTSPASAYSKGKAAAYAEIADMFYHPNMFEFLREELAKRKETI